MIRYLYENSGSCGDAMKHVHFSLYHGEFRQHDGECSKLSLPGRLAFMCPNSPVVGFAQKIAYIGPAGVTSESVTIFNSTCTIQLVFLIFYDY